MLCKQANECFLHSATSTSPFEPGWRLHRLTQPLIAGSVALRLILKGVAGMTAMENTMSKTTIAVTNWKKINKGCHKLRFQAEVFNR